MMDLIEKFKQKPRPLVLIVLDGWGVAKPNEGNGISQTKTPVFDELIAKYPCAVLKASGEAVGLPNDVFGNSEVGHLTLGAGRICDQELQKINKLIKSKRFFSNPALLRAIEHVKTNQSALHLMGLMSDGRVHSSLDHLLALLDLTNGSSWAARVKPPNPPPRITIFFFCIPGE